MTANRKPIGPDGELDEAYENEGAPFARKPKNVLKFGFINRSLLVGVIIGFSMASVIALLEFRTISSLPVGVSPTAVSVITTSTPIATTTLIAGVDTACLTALPNNHNRILSSEQIGKFTKIVVTDDHGSAICQVSDSSAASDLGASWFPDGKTISFGSKRGGVFGLYTMSIGDSSAHLVTDDVVTVAYFNSAVSPDGKRIAFTSNSDVYEIGVDGSSRQQLTHFKAPSSVISSVSWSRDTILFDSSAIDPRQVYAVKPDGSNLHVLAEGKGEGSDAVQSPDGQKIALDLNGDLTIMNSDGTNLQSLSRPGFSPSWSPDGQYLVIMTEGNPETMDIVKADGTLVRHVAPNTEWWGAPKWQP